MTTSCHRSTLFRVSAESHPYPQSINSRVSNFWADPKLRTRVAVAQRIELFDDYKDGCGFKSHQSHASAEALGFSHLEPLFIIFLVLPDYLSKKYHLVGCLGFNR